MVVFTIIYEGIQTLFLRLLSQIFITELTSHIQDVSSGNRDLFFEGSKVYLFSLDICVSVTLYHLIYGTFCWKSPSVVVHSCKIQVLLICTNLIHAFPHFLTLLKMLFKILFRNNVGGLNPNLVQFVLTYKVITQNG